MGAGKWYPTYGFLSPPSVRQSMLNAVLLGFLKFPVLLNRECAAIQPTLQSLLRSSYCHDGGSIQKPSHKDSKGIHYVSVYASSRKLEVINEAWASLLGFVLSYTVFYH